MAMPALVAHIVHDLEARFGFIDLMSGGATASLRLRSDWDDEERLFVVSPRHEGLALLSPALDTPDRYWHVMSLDHFGEPDEYDDQALYVQINAGVGFVPTDAASAAVAIEVTDGEGEHGRVFEAPLLRDADAWAEWRERVWPRVTAYSLALVRRRVADDHLHALMRRGGDGSALAA